VAKHISGREPTLFLARRQAGKTAGKMPALPMAIDLEHVREVVARVTASSGLELVDVEFRGAGGKARMLRVFIDKPGGVTHADCESVSREVGTILDVEDAVPGGSYTLEVSSPGLDRKLTRPEEFARFVGSRVKLTTREPIEGNRFFEGRLESFQGGTLVLAVGPAKAKRGKPEQPARHEEIAFSNVERANLVPEF
jgi:ribosome maturation factor RimP